MGHPESVVSNRTAFPAYPTLTVLRSAARSMDWAQVFTASSFSSACRVDFDKDLFERVHGIGLTSRTASKRFGGVRHWLESSMCRWGNPAWRLRRALLRASPTLVHCLSGAEAVALLEAWDRGAPRSKLVVSMTGGDLGKLSRSPAWAIKIRRALEAAAAVLTESEESRQEIVRLGSPREKTVRLSRPLPLGLIPAAGPRPHAHVERDRRLRLLFLGPFVERQGISFLLEAVARLARRGPGIHLTLAGSGPLWRPAQLLARHLGLEERVDFRPSKCSLETWLRLLSECDALVCPSLTASDGDRESGPPLSILVALAAAVPVVATRHAGIPEVIQDGRTGFLAREGDIDGLVSALARVRKFPEVAREAGKAGRAKVELEHCSEAIQAELEQIYLAAARS